MKRYVKILPLAALFFAFSTNAEVALKDNSEILGKWKLYAEATKLDGEQKPVTIEWEFKERWRSSTNGDRFCWPNRGDENSH